MSTSTSQSIIDWEAMSKVANLEEIIPLLPPEKIIQVLGLPRLIGAAGADKVLAELLHQIPKERIQEALQQEQQNGN